MLIAQEKLQNNIAEYVIYMFQLEDVMRSFKLDWELVKINVVHPQTPNPSFLKESEKWFYDLLQEMKSRGLDKKGHLYCVNEVINELAYLHSTLHDIVKDSKYLALFEVAQPNIEDFQKKSELTQAGPVEVCFQALYMKLLLRLQKKEISAESEQAFDSMRILLAYLSKGYHQMKSGNMDMFTAK